jgi:hypothetical protein
MPRMPTRFGKTSGPLGSFAKIENKKLMKSLLLRNEKEKDLQGQLHFQLL